jgi:hypothetical protein
LEGGRRKEMSEKGAPLHARGLIKYNLSFGY